MARSQLIDTETRHSCLSHALELSNQMSRLGKVMDPDQIVAAAEKFETYVTKEKS